MAVMLRPAIVLFLLVWPLGAAAQGPAPATECRLAPGLWQQRQALRREFDASGGRAGAAWQALQSIHAQYRRFVLVLARDYEGKQAAEAGACCDATSHDPEAAIFCALVRYRLGGRSDAASFLRALPPTPVTAAALDQLRQAGSPDANASSLAASPVANVTEDVFRLMLAGNSVATADYFYLLHHSGGAWADDAADQLEDYLAHHPAALIRNWPLLRTYWNLSDGITWDVDAAWWEALVPRYRAACAAPNPETAQPISPRPTEPVRGIRSNPPDSRTRRATRTSLAANCRQILALLEIAARAAGAPK